MKTPRIYPDLPFLELFLMLVQQLFLQTDDVLALVVVDQVHALQRRDHVILLDARLFTYFIDCYQGSFPIFISFDSQ